ncbi:MAG: hypothetical protein F9K40_04515 [Kofleriaceae bacterium]|nr:MAG: hypothetical protein F9K40_04515 [Kofleriaceae bacterium]
MTTRRLMLAIASVLIGAGVLLAWCVSGRSTKRSSLGAPAEPNTTLADPPRTAAVTSDARQPSGFQLPARRSLSGPPPHEMRFRLDPDDAHTKDPQTQQVRREMFEGLLRFRDEAVLTDEQWRFFLAELQETAVSFGYLINDRGFNRITDDDFRMIAEELGRDLEERLARHLTERQMGTFRFRFRANRLPHMLAVGNILQDPDDPDRKAWTIPNDVVLPNDVPLPPDAPGQNL